MINHPLHSFLPEAPWLDTAAWKLPGVQPSNWNQWILVDEAYAGQMALRDHLIATRESEVHQQLESALAPAQECLELILETLDARTDYKVQRDSVTRPDGKTVSLDVNAPLKTAGRLIQQDICILQKPLNEHVLTGAVLCFPASWTLKEKIGKPMTRIHLPVSEYTEELARRVQRIFDGLHEDRLVWRANALIYEKPDLYSPRRETDGIRHILPEGGFLRSERQTLRKLPVSGALVFSIHTYVLPVDRLSSEQAKTLDLVRVKSD